MKNCCFVVAACLAITAGCDNAVKDTGKVFPAAKPVTIVIQPGYEIADAGKVAKIFGFEKCPKTGIPLMGSEQNVDSAHCIVITPTTKKVDVTVSINGRLANEQWSVEHGSQSADSITLRRPDGSLVTSKKYTPLRG